MTSAATIATTIVSTACQNGVLDESPYVSSDELMLEELERRDGMYSFIFHELDSSKLTKAVEPENNHNHSPIQIHELDSPKLTKIVEQEINHNRSPIRNGLASEATYFKKLGLSQQLHTEVVKTKGSDSVKIASSVKNISSLTNGERCEFNVAKTILNSTAAAPTPTPSPTTTTTTAATAIITAASTVKTLAAASTTTATTTTTTSTTKESTTKLPTQNELLRYQQYLRTWYPPTPTPPPPPTVRTRPLNFMKASPSSPFYLNKRPSNLYVCMMNCGVSVRQQPPRFSHITEPLVRNRRHALKETDEYKQQTNNSNSMRVPDLRALFPYDPDVHAPFLTSKPKADNNASSCLMEHLDVKSNEKALLTANGEIK